jgi:uncharacterized 2Fe-2S/4Fe-4S cluster protein (DUF4445 family)
MGFTVKVLFEPFGLRVDAIPGETILDAAIRGGVGIRSECGGTQVCGKCLIHVRDQRGLTAVTLKESRQLGNRIHAGYRLACSATFLAETDHVTVVVPSESVVRRRQFVEVGSERSVSLEPALVKLSVEVLQPSINDKLTDTERLLASIRNLQGDAEIELDFNVLAGLPETLRKSKFVTALIWDKKKVISVDGMNDHDSLYGLAIDIGTSRITCSLLDLISGVRLIHASVENPQIAYGEDILTRVSYTQANVDNGKHLQHTIVAGINELLENMCRAANLSPLRVYEAVVVGNTVMHHLALGLETKYLAQSPFIPVTSDSVSIRAAELGLRINPNAVVHFLPIIDAFVGGDAVADILSSGIHRHGAPTMLLDIGTNTEVILRDRGGLTCCSCASGPAFEGVHIEHGIKAVEGALESVNIGAGGFDVKYSVLEGVKPVGLCGSAIIDVVAELFKRNLIDRFGKFSSNVETPRLIKVNGVKKFVLVYTEDSGTGRDIVVSERDINEVMLAKAAIYTGCSILMRRRGLTRGELSRILIAGGFGKSLNRRNVRLIGLIPDVPSSRISFIGNAAHAGAEAALRSRRVLHLADKVARGAEYIELAACKEFSEEFTAALMLPHKKLELFNLVNRTYPQ